MSATAYQSVEELAQRRPRARDLRPLRALWPFVLRYRLMLAGALAALVVATLAALAMPLAVRFMIDEGFGSAEAGAVNRYFLALVLVAVVLGLASAARFYCVTWLGEKTTNDLRYQVYDHLLTLHAAFYATARTGELVSRLTADATLIRTIIGSSVSIALRNAFLFVGSTVMLVATSWSLSLYLLASLPLVLLPIIAIGRLVRRRARTSQDRLAAASAMLAESLAAMQLVQSFTHEPQQRRLFAASLDESFVAARRRIAARAAMTAVAIILVFVSVVAILWLGARQMLAGELSVGLLGQFMLYAVLCATSIGALSEVWGEVQLAAGATERLSEVLRVRTEIRSPAQPRPLAQPVRGALGFHDVHFAYPGRSETPALQRVSWQLPPGQKCALVGASGAGKSTIFQLLLRFYDPQRGRIALDGVPLPQLDLAALRRAIAIVPQETVLFAGSVADNIRFGRPTASDADLAAAAKAALADEFIHDLPDGYSTMLGERGVNLSGGQRQRLAIARAILRDSPILLLDEATNALDAHSEALVQEALARLMAGRSSVIIAHRLATVRNAHHIVMMDKGKIMAQGTHAQLIAGHRAYQELVRLQFEPLESAPAAKSA